MDRYRVRIRFRKEGDLRFTSHRDLVRAFERLFRRAELKLRMSEGFHPKARMSFPSALGLGIEGLNESMDVELAEPPDEVELQRCLSRLAPPGLTIVEVRSLAPGEAKGQVARIRYAVDLPPSLMDPIHQAAIELMATETWEVRRAGRDQPIDVRKGVESLEVVDGQLQMTLLASRQASVRPREVLEALGHGDLESQGMVLKRTAVEFAE